MPTAADVALVVPVGGDAVHWAVSAESLARLQPPPGEIIVVVDGPVPEAGATGRSIGATVVELDERGGPARARNRGVERSSRDFVLFVDADIAVPDDLVSRVVDGLSAHPEAVAVIGSYDDEPGDSGFLSQYRNLLHHFVHQGGREEASTFWSGCGAVDRSAFEAVGGFDQRYREPIIEDIELGARLIRGGFSIRLVKSLQVKHLKRWRWWEMLKTDLWHRAVPWTELMLRDGNLVNDLNVDHRSRVSVALAFGVVVAVAASLFWWPGLAVGGLGACLLAGVNHRFFRFIFRKRGLLMTLGVVPMFGIYLLTCGLGFGIGLARHLLRAARPTTADSLTR